MTWEHPLAAYAPDDVWFRRSPRGIHGAPHTTRVLVWANRLAGMIAVPTALRLEELRWAAAVHDVGRINDDVDPGHGARSADWLRDHLTAARPAAAGVDLEFVAELCRWHETRDDAIKSFTLEMMILKDADGLDRCRIHGLDPRRLRLTRSHDLVQDAERLERATDDYGRVGAADVLAADGRLFPR